MNRHYHIVKNEDLLSIVWDWITNESNPKKKARSFHSNEKKILFVPSPSADAYQYKELLHYNWSKATTPKFATNIACPYHIQIEYFSWYQKMTWNHQHSHHQKTSLKSQLKYDEYDLISFNDKHLIFLWWGMWNFGSFGIVGCFIDL
jgi:hypothetical protein